MRKTYPTRSKHRADIEQTSSNYLEHTSCTCILNAFAGCLLDDCSMFAWSCKRVFNVLRCAVVTEVCEKAREWRPPLTSPRQSRRSLLAAACWVNWTVHQASPVGPSRSQPCHWPWLPPLQRTYHGLMQKTQVNFAHFRMQLNKRWDILSCRALEDVVRPRFPGTGNQFF